MKLRIVLILATSLGISWAQQVLTFGQSVPLTGHYSAMGKAYSNGVQAAFAEYNAKAGMPYRFNLQLLDDNYNGSKGKYLFKHLVLTNIRRFSNDANIYGIVGGIGNPDDVMQQVIEIVAAKQMPYIGALSGDLSIRGKYIDAGNEKNPIQRSKTFPKWVINIRGSVLDEAAAMVDYLLSTAKTRISVFYSSDSYGSMVYIILSK